MLSARMRSACSAILLGLVAISGQAQGASTILQLSQGLPVLVQKPNGPPAHDAPNFRLRRTVKLNSHRSRDQT